MRLFEMTADLGTDNMVSFCLNDISFVCKFASRKVDTFISVVATPPIPAPGIVAKFTLDFACC